MSLLDVDGKDMAYHVPTNMIQPFQKDDALLADIQKSSDDVRFWWLGQSGFLLQYRGSHLLFDPYLSDSLTEKYAQTDKPHTRMTERCIAPETLNFVDVVTSSHNHTDHLDAATLQGIFRGNKDLNFVIPEANRAFVSERIGCFRDFPIGLDDGETQNVGGWLFHGIAAAHNELETDGNGRHKFLGFVVKFGPFSVYHSGDTLLYEGLAEKLKPFGVDVAFLPINGNRPERRVAGNMNGLEAANLAREIGAKLVVPHHFEMFEFNTASPDEFKAECERIGQNYRVLQCGEGCDIDP